MADAALTAKQALRRIVAEAFPWLPSIVVQASAKGKGLCIRAASGLLHLAGGPDDPAVHRVGDLGSAGTWSIGDGVASTLVYTPADGSTPVGVLLSVSGTPAQAVVVSPAAPVAPIATQTTIAQTGSNKVTCA